MNKIMFAVAIALASVSPATAQFDPHFNHLKCYQIKDKAVIKTLVLDNQFGREMVVKLIPQLLCVPTRKTCCEPNSAGITGCHPVPCPLDPTPNQPAPVDHFKCYKIVAKTCANIADETCNMLRKFQKTIKVNLKDQFGVEEVVTVGPPRLLCAPVQKTVLGVNTTTTTHPTDTTVTITTSTTSTTRSTTTNSTTTTTIPCRNIANPGQFPVCDGDCPPNMKCLVINQVACQCQP